MELDNVTECNLRWEEFPKDNEIRRERSLTAKVGDMMQINKGMVLIKVVYSLINLGWYTLYPYLTLQAYGLGLTYEDIGIIYGLTPLLSLAASPVSGFIGDKVGYRVILILHTLVCALSATGLTLIPVYKEYEQIPHAVLFKNSSAAGSSDVPYNIVSVQWSICQNTFDTGDCQASLDGSLAGIADYLSCPEDVMEDYSFGDVALTGNETNGTFCKVTNEFFSAAEHPQGHALRCDIVGYPGMDVCGKTVGSHAVTFYTYLAARTGYQWCMSAIYSLLDATALRLAKEHNSDYSKVQIWAQVPATFGVLIPGLVLQDADGGGESTDYSILFYMYDGYFLLAAVLMIWLNVTLERSGQSTLEALKKIWNKSALIVFSLLFILGIQWGVQDSFVLVYLTDEMGASSQLTSIMIFVGALCSLIGCIVAKKIISRAGELNMVSLGIFVESARLTTWGLVKASPPRYSLLLFAMDPAVLWWPWIATMFYSHKIFLPDLIATMVGIATVCQWTVGKGIGSLVGGQLTGVMNVADLFLWTAVFTAICNIFVLVVRLVFGAKWEKKVMAEKKDIMRKVGEKEDGGGENLDRHVGQESTRF